MSVYLFKKTMSRKRSEKITRQASKPLVNDEPPVGEIQGIMPDSKEEWRWALALNHIKVRYYYQFTIYGGRNISGGEIIDFMVLTKPYSTPVFIHGRYWHTGRYSSDETYYTERLSRYMRGQIMKPVIVWDDEIPNLDAAYRKAKELFG